MEKKKMNNMKEYKGFKYKLEGYTYIIYDNYDKEICVYYTNNETTIKKYITYFRKKYLGDK